MSAHERLEEGRSREEAEPFTETCSAPQLGQLRFIGERARLELVDAEEVSELGMLLVENRARLADRVLTPRERVDVHRMVVPRDRALVVVDLQALRIEPIGELDVFPRGRRKGGVERMR